MSTNAVKNQFDSLAQEAQTKRQRLADPDHSKRIRFHDTVFYSDSKTAPLKPEAQLGPVTPSIWGNNDLELQAVGLSAFRLFKIFSQIENPRLTVNLEWDSLLKIKDQDQLKRALKDFTTKYGSFLSQAKATKNQKDDEKDAQEIARDQAIDKLKQNILKIRDFLTKTAVIHPKFLGRFEYFEQIFKEYKEDKVIEFTKENKFFIQNCLTIMNELET